jgi:putative molybdopterin biosynthesis protein
MQGRRFCNKKAETAVSLMTTAELADYLRLKERTVYDLVARQAIPCSRATGKLLFSRALIDAWVEAHTETPGGASTSAPRIYAGSSEPLLEWALRQAGVGLAVLVGGSRLGLEALARGEAMLAGVHMLDPESGAYNVPAIRALVPRSDIVGIRWARREQGLLVPPGNPLGIEDLSDVARRGLRLAHRGEGAGSRILLETLLRGHGLAPDAVRAASRTAESEDDLASMIAMDDADCGLGIRAASAGLDFVPLAREEFDLVLRRRDYFEPPFQSLLAFARTEAFARRAAFLGGYDLEGLGDVRYNA